MRQNKIPTGVATYLGVAAAVVQYATAVVVLLAGGPTDAAIAALATATVALVGVLTGRYAQATAKAKRGPVARVPAAPAAPVVNSISSGVQVGGTLGQPTMTTQLDSDDDSDLPADGLHPSLGPNSGIPADRIVEEPTVVDQGNNESASATGAMKEGQS